MFYELIGTFVARGGTALDERHGPKSSDDERIQREFRQIALLMRRVGAIWPNLFESLAEESAVLMATLEKMAEPLARAGVVVGQDARDCPDPLKRYRILSTELDRAVIALHNHHGEAWAADALHELRRGLAAAAEIQGQLVDAALSA